MHVVLMALIWTLFFYLRVHESISQNMSQPLCSAACGGISYSTDVQHIALK